MDRRTLPEKGKQFVEQVSDVIEEKSEQVTDRLVEMTQAKASEVTEEAITSAVDQAVNVIQIASERVRQKNLPTENVDLEVEVSIAGVVNLKMKADAPTSAQVESQTDMG
jgi:hypothetical protein